MCAALADVARPCVFCFLVFGALAHSISICTDYFIILHLVVCTYPHSSWYECLMGETGINHILAVDSYFTRLGCRNLPTEF